ncbi:hypothetical protein BSK64_23670 [Paenibacillus odorifer]|nr:hypothetical protein BSK64_23670 [Paenibacillus odorifer]
MGEHRQRYNEEFKNRQCSSFKSKQRQWATWRKSLTSQKVPCINGVYVAVYSVYVSHVGEYPPVEPYIPPFQLLQLLSTGFIPYILPSQLFMQNNYEVRSQLQFSLPYIINSAS